jgi:chorismate mutase/prephenate dehydrogenase
MERVRQEIDRVDEQLISLLSRRFALSKEMGKLKSKLGTGIRDESRELKVWERWLSLSKSHPVPEQFLQILFEELMSFSRAIQVSTASQKRRVVIVGYGGMARSLSSLMIMAGHAVTVTGEDMKKADAFASEFNIVTMNWREAVNWGEYLLLAVPPAALQSEIIDGILRMSNGKVVMDIFSSKTTAFSKLNKLSKEIQFNYVSTHPLFGPHIYPVGERIVIIPGENIESNVLNDVCGFWLHSGLTPVLSSVDEHERAMAVVQVLTHFLILGFDQAVEVASREMQVDPQKFSTVTFRELNRIRRRVRSLKNVIMEVQLSNPHASKVREITLRELGTISSKIEGAL